MGAPGIWRSLASLVLLMTANTLSVVDRAAFPLLLVVLGPQLQLSHAQVGVLGGTAFSLVSGSCALLLASITDFATDRRVVLAGALLVFSLATALCSLPVFASLFACRMLVGLGEAAVVPCAHGLIADSFGDTHRGRALSAFSMSLFLGFGIAFFTTSLVTGANNVVVATPWGLLHRWQLFFICTGLFGVMVCFAMIGVLEPRKHALEARTPPSLRLIWKEFAKRRNLFILIYVGTAALICLNNPWTVFTMFFFVKSVGFPSEDVSVVMGILSLTLGPFGAFFFGWLSDAFEHRGYRSAPCVLAAFCAFGIAATSVARPLCVAYPFTSLMLAGSHIFFDAGAFSMTVVFLQRCAPKSGRSITSGLLLTAVSVGFLIGPAAVGLLSDRVFARDISRALLWWSVALSAITLPLFVGIVLEWRRTCEVAERAVDVPLVSLAEFAE